MKLTSLEFDASRFPEGTSVKINGNPVETTTQVSNDKIQLDFSKEVTVKQGDNIKI
ncbi:MAG: hypothetical protein ACOC10_08020 [Bacteroidota bacterium]